MAAKKPEDQPKVAKTENIPKKEEAPPEKPKKAKLPFKITTSSKRQHTRGIIYGPSGVGKTTFISTLQDCKQTGDLIIADTDQGTLSISDRDDIDIVSMKTFGQFARFHEFLRDHCHLRQNKDKAGLIKLEAKFKDIDPKEITKPKIYRSVAIDQLTETQKLNMYGLLGIHVDKVSLDDELTQPEFKEWGASAEMMRLLVRTFRNLPMHVWFVCLEKEMEDDTGRLSSRIAVPGKLAAELPAYVDVVGYLATKMDEKGNIDRRLFLQPSKRYTAKDRYHVGNTVKYIQDPTIEKFLTEKGVIDG